MPRVGDKKSPLNSVELFAGGGGMALGLHAAGFHSVALLERDRHAVATLRLNAKEGTGVTPDLPIEETDVREFNYDRLEGARVDLLAGGAPCQPFSLGGKHNGSQDERNLFPEVFRAQRELRPKALLLENVRGLTRSSFRPYLQYILLQVAMPGLMPSAPDERWQDHKDRLLAALRSGEATEGPTYHVHMAATDCANFGVPQNRARVFIVAFRTDLGVEWRWPPPTHSKESLLNAQFVTGDYWSEHGLAMPETDPPKAVLRANGSQRWRTVRDTLRRLPEPVARRTHPYHPNHVGVSGAKSYPGHTGSPWDKPAKTLKAGVHGCPGGENMLRDDDGSVRYFTVHESALLQGFPSRYVFTGSRSEAMRQIGNAAPTPVCHMIGSAIREQLVTSPQAAQKSPPHVDLVRGRGLTVL
jgi:DNA (cytosine-5)-methyltransferase 1